jgi:elongator complex protein 3
MDQKTKQKLKDFFKNIDLKKIEYRELQRLKSDFAKKYKLPKLILTSDILNTLKINKPTKTFVTKPSRTLSGVTIISVMTKPDKCPGNCIFCPNFKNTPKSYTGFEPASMRGKLNNFDPYKQIKDRIKQLEAIGHPTNKLELIIMGGTFPATSKKYQTEFMIKTFQAIANSKEKNLEKLKKKLETSKKRIVGITFETRPDYCDEEIIKGLLEFGGTRVEIGAQTTDDAVHLFIKRGHGTKEIIEATQKLKDSGFKVLYHMMIGLPGSTIKKDFKSFKEIFTNQKYCPDMIKIYPCLVTENTVLEKMYYSQKYIPYTEKQVIKLIADVKEIVPKWVRIMRVQRDIPATKILAGITKSNLRELVFKELENRNKKCNCIRCSEPRGKKITNTDYKIKKIKYNASFGTEYFIYAENENFLLGFIRLRIPYKPFITEITKSTGIIRELHVYGQATEFNEQKIQHTGVGKKLLNFAEEIAKKENMTSIAIISGIGVREYYKKQGYFLKGNYMFKKDLI